MNYGFYLLVDVEESGYVVVHEVLSAKFLLARISAKQNFEFRERLEEHWNCFVRSLLHTNSIVKR